MEMELVEAEQLDEFQKAEGAQKEREINNGKDGGVASGQGSLSNTEEALVSSVIQKLDNKGVWIWLSDELKMILNFLRDKTPGEFSRLHYLKCKVMETVLNLNNIMETCTYNTYSMNDQNSVRRRLRGIRMRMLKSAEEKNALVLISPVLQKLEHHHVEISSFPFLDNGHIGDLKGVIDELRMILGFLSDKSIAELRRLDWFICEAIEIVLYLDVIEGTNNLWEEARSVKSRLQGIKLRMLRSGVDGEEDPETLILSVIQNLDVHHVDIAIPVSGVEDIKGVINELRMILDFLREEKTDLILRRRHKKYLICDLIEMALYLNEIDDPTGNDLCKETESVQSWLREIRLCMLKPETRTETRSEDVGEGGDMVGLDEQVQLVLRRGIFNEGKGLQTLAITGIVGIGKTSLARLVYNHASVVEQFKLRAWVHVSSDLTHKEILMKLIQQVVVVVDSSLVEEMDNRSLQHLLHQHLEGMPYLIVLDDLPKHMHLKSLSSAFPNDEGSRLLVTSRTKNIQTTVSFTLRMKPLDPDKSWKLFLNTIFRGDKFSSEQKFPKHLEEKRREMLRKCGGLPLAIKEVALQLAEQRRRGSEWEQLLDSIDWDSTLALLENFYQQLDEEQKLFFLHLAVFKENTSMRAEKLVNVFVAVGLASESELMTYIIKLNSEFIIEFKHISMENRLKSCVVNVVLHRLSMKKAGKEIGFEVWRDNDANNQLSQSIPRHRIIYCGREKFDYPTNRNKHLVSLFFRGGGRYLDATDPCYWKSFELELRILDLEDFGLKILPASIGTLIELRYLGLRNNYLQKLPHSLVCLNKLEILDVALNFAVEVPDIICDMSSLRRVYMSYAIFEKPLNTDALKNLVTVMYISIDDLICEPSSLHLERLGTEEKDSLPKVTSLKEPGIEEEDGLQTMTSLTKLGIEEVDATSDVRKLFASLDGLLHLVLRGFRFRSMPCLDELHILHSLTTLRLEGLLAKLPSAKNFPPCISYLRLVNTCLDEDPMPVLEQLPYLKQLKLRNAYTGRQMVISDEWPVILEALCIEELWNLRNVHVKKGALWLLRELEIKNCPLLETLPEEIGSMAQLQEFNMTTTRNIATKIRKSACISKIRIVHIDP